MGSESASNETLGVLGLLKRLGLRVITGAETRVELLSVELREELLRFVHLLVLGAIACFCLGLAVIVAVILVCVAVWDHPVLRLSALVTVGSAFALTGWLVAKRIKRMLREGPLPFEATLLELRKDRRWLETLTSKL